MSAQGEYAALPEIDGWAQERGIDVGTLRRDPPREVPAMSWAISLGATYDLTVTDVWPDGDWPDAPTAADVVAVMKKCDSLQTLIREWNLDDALELDVDGIAVFR